MRVRLLFSLDLAAEARFLRRRLCSMRRRSSSDILRERAAVVPFKSGSSAVIAGADAGATGLFWAESGESGREAREVGEYAEEEREVRED